MLAQLPTCTSSSPWPEPQRSASAQIRPMAPRPRRHPRGERVANNSPIHPRPENAPAIPGHDDSRTARPRVVRANETCPAFGHASVRRTCPHRSARMGGAPLPSAPIADAGRGIGDKEGSRRPTGAGPCDERTGGKPSALAGGPFGQKAGSNGRAVASPWPRKQAPEARRRLVSRAAPHRCRCRFRLSDHPCGRAGRAAGQRERGVPKCRA